jgi:hypothetical protein
MQNGNLLRLVALIWELLLDPTQLAMVILLLLRQMAEPQPSLVKLQQIRRHIVLRNGIRVHMERGRSIKLMLLIIHLVALHSMLFGMTLFLMVMLPFQLQHNAPDLDTHYQDGLMVLQPINLKLLTRQLLLRL